MDAFLSIFNKTFDTERKDTYLTSISQLLNIIDSNTKLTYFIDQTLVFFSSLFEISFHLIKARHTEFLIVY